MNWDVVGAIGEVIGAVAVVLSLFFIGRQIQSSTKAVRGQTFQSLSQHLNEDLDLLKSPALLQIAIEVLDGKGAAQLSQEDYWQYVSWFGKLLRHGDTVYFQHSLGLIAKDQLLVLTFVVRMHASTSLGKAYLNSMEDLVSNEFLDFLRTNTVAAKRESMMEGIRPLPTETADDS